MTPSARRLSIAVPVLGLGLIILLLVRGFRVEETEAPAPRKRAGSVAPAFAPSIPGEEAPEPEAPVLPALAVSAESAAASEEVRIESTYDNYRTAVVTGNADLAAALRPVLLRDRTVAVGLARRELSEAADDDDRDLARKVLDSLER